MRLTCEACGQEIVGAFRISGYSPEDFRFRWSSVPEVINAHNAGCRNG